jgi:hypothetical protein
MRVVPQLAASSARRLWGERLAERWVDSFVDNGHIGKPVLDERFAAGR